MNRSICTLLSVVVLALMSVPAAGQKGPGGAPGAIIGMAEDSSGGVLPGVNVTVLSDSDQVLATTVTGEKGTYKFDSVPPRVVDVVFHLDGFADRRTRVTVPAGGVVEVVGSLSLATLTERVVVRGELPPPPPPRPVIVPVPAHDQASVCGPARAEGAVIPVGTIQSRRSDARQGLIGAGDEIVIEGGSTNGIGIGQNLVARRLYRAKGFGASAGAHVGEHTSGVLQIVAVEERQSLAVVVYACDEMMRGDYLAAFQPEPLRTPDRYGLPAFDDAAQILFADAGQMLGYASRMMVVDRGSRQGLRAGQRLTIFRRAKRGNTPQIVGDAVVVTTRPDSATIRVEQSSDVVLFGDYAAPQKGSTRSN